MAKTNTAKVTLGFDDSTTDYFTIENVDDEDLADIGTKAKALNANYPNDLKTLFVSTGGASSTRIAAVSYTETTEEVLFDTEVIPQ